MVASQSLEVVLRLDASQLQAGLGASAVAVKNFDEQVGRVGGTSAQSFGAAGTTVSALRGHVDLTSQQVAQLGRQTANFGQAMTLGVTLPIVAAGTAAVKLGLDFDTACSRMVGLAGVPTAEVDGLKKAVLDLAGQTAQAPVDLANALYFIESAGLHGSTALDALRVSAMAAEAGMGDVQTVADALTSVMSAYGAANISAAHAGDVLTVAVRDGKAEASAFAPELGRLLPAATALKIPFDDVAGSLAFLTRSSGDTALSATQLSGIFNSLISPSVQANKALQSIGLSAEDLRNVVGTQGLSATLNLLNDRFHGNVDAMHAVFPDIRAMNGVIQLTGTHAAGLAQVLDDTKNSTGALGQAAAAFASTPAGKMQQAITNIQVDAVKMGEAIAPMVANVVQGLSSIVDEFTALPKPAQDVIVVFAGLLATSGPLITIGGRIAQGWGLAVTVFNDVHDAVSVLAVGEVAADAAMTASLGPIGLLATAAGGLLVALKLVSGGEHNAAVNAADYTSALKDQSGAMSDNVDEVSAQALAQDGAARAASQAGLSYKTMFDAIRNGTDDFGKFADEIKQAGSVNVPTLSDALHKAGADGTQFGRALLQLADSGKLNRDQMLGLVQAIEGLHNKYQDAVASTKAEKDALSLLGPTADDTSMHIANVGTVTGSAAVQLKNLDDSFKQLDDDLHATVDPLFGMQKALEANQQAQAGSQTAQDALNQAIAQYGPTSLQAAAAQQQLTDANVKSASSALDVQDAAIKLNDAVAQQPGLLGTAISTLQQWVANGKISQQTADAMAAQFTFAAASASSIPGSVVTNVSAPGAETVIQQLQEIGTETNLLASNIVLGVALPRRYGGIVEHAAAGRLRDAGVYPAGSSPLYAFAEPGTGGEGFVPKNGVAARSRPIIETEAAWYGGTVSWGGHALHPNGSYASPGSSRVQVDAPAQYIVTGDVSAMQLALLERAVDKGNRKLANVIQGAGI